MADRSVSILIQAKDQASKQFGTVGKSVAVFGKTTESSLAGVRNAVLATAAAFIKLAAIVAPFVAVSKVIGLVTDSLAEFGEAGEGAAQLKAALLSTGGAAKLTAEEITGLAEKMQRLTKFEGDATVGAAAILATFNKIKGDTFKEAIVLAMDMATRMKGELQPAIIQVGKALQDPTKGVTALTKAGVSFSAAQKQQIATMQKTSGVAAAQVLILKELRKEFGGAALAEGRTFSGQMTQLGNVIGDLKEKIGEGLAPVVLAFAEIIKGLAPTINGAIESMLAGFRGFSVGILGAFTAGEVAMDSFHRAMSMMALVATKNILEMKGRFEHLFGKVMPSFLSWFAGNFPKIIAHTMTAALSEFEKFTRLAKMNIEMLWEIIRSGGKPDAARMLEIGLGASKAKGAFVAPLPLPPMNALIPDGKKDPRLAMIDREVMRLAMEPGKNFGEEMAKRLGAVMKIAAPQGVLGAVPFAGKDDSESPASKVAKQNHSLAAVEARFLTRGTGRIAATPAEREQARRDEKHHQQAQRNRGDIIRMLREIKDGQKVIVVEGAA